mmetsp:Transcript_23523/g.28928  ORF Transcript_23523/g.28928 Transcript_23523/m.28928 type:complete len:86 (+) Transcript_23523:249-506(+)
MRCGRVIHGVERMWSRIGWLMNKKVWKWCVDWNISLTLLPIIDYHVWVVLYSASPPKNWEVTLMLQVFAKKFNAFEGSNVDKWYK